MFIDPPDFSFSRLSCWTANRLHWRRNRKLFEIVFIHISLPLKFLRIADKMGKIDLNLIYSWRQFKYLNLCSTEVIQKKSCGKNHNFICRKSLTSRTIQQIFFVEKISGCICCTTNNKKLGPIWWDQLTYIPLIFNLKIFKLLLYRLYHLSIVKRVQFFHRKKIFFLEKISNILKVYRVCIRVDIFLYKIFQKLYKQKQNYIKQWNILF